MRIMSMSVIVASTWIVGIIAPVCSQEVQPPESRAATQLTAANWVMTGGLNIARSAHTATLLQSGMVLVAGGRDNNSMLDSAELYDPATGTWGLTNRMSAPRIDHTATLLPNGKVLVLGGTAAGMGPPKATNTAELYDPATGTWTLTGNLKVATSEHTATLLSNGTVLVAGGYDSGTVIAAQLYDPATGAWSLTGNLVFGRWGHTATLLQDGRVLVAGGSDSDMIESTLTSAELYEPVTGTWSVTQRPTIAGGIFHTATLLPNGNVLVAGGDGGGIGGDTIFANSELFDPATQSWRSVDNLTAARFGHTATLLPSGKVLAAGGKSQVNSLDSTETFDVSAGTWISADSLHEARSLHTATLIQDGRVLVAGGSGAGPPYTMLNSSELYGAPLLAGTIGPGYTGNWYDPAQSGHGLFIQVLPDNRFLAAWFTFDPAGTQQAWFTGVGSYSGNTATIAAVEQPSGGRWIPNFDPSKVVHNAWGTLTFTFTDCDHGKVDFNSMAGYGTGSMKLTRLTQPAGLTCP